MPQRKEALALSPPPVLSRFLQQEGIIRRASVSEVVLVKQYFIINVVKITGCHV